MLKPVDFRLKMVEFRLKMVDFILQSTRRPVRHILVGVGCMEPKHVHTLLMQCGLTALADAFFDVGVDGGMLLQLKDAEHQGELDKWCEKASKSSGQKRLGRASPRSRGVDPSTKGLSCDMKTRRTILRAVEEIESGTGKLSGWITVPVPPRRNAWSGGCDDSDSDEGGEEGIDDMLDMDGLLAVASSPRVSASGTPAIYAPPYNVVGESSLQLGEGAASNAERHTINRTVLGRRKELDQGYGYTDVTLRTAFPLEVLESYADSQAATWKVPGFKWDALTAQRHVEAIGQAIAESAQEAARRSVGVGATGGLFRQPNTDTVISMLLQAERGDVRASPVIERLEDSLKLESVEGLYLLRGICIHNKSHNLHLLLGLNYAYTFPGVGTSGWRSQRWFRMRRSWRLSTPGKGRRGECRRSCGGCCWTPRIAADLRSGCWTNSLGT